MSKFYRQVYTNTAAIATATTFSFTLDVQEFESFSVIVQNEASAALSLDFKALHGDISASMAKAEFFTGSACSVGNSAAQIYKMDANSLDKLKIDMSATATVAANEVNVYLIGRKSD